MRSTISGPSIVVGNTNPAQLADPDVGPSLQFQGDGIVDPRLVGSVDAAPGSLIYGLFTNGYFVSTDGIPVVLSATRVAPAANPTASTAMTLNTTNGTGVATNIPILPFGVAPNIGNIVTVPLALDFGFTIGNTSGTSITIPAGAWRYFYKGQRLCIAGGATSTTPFFTTVTATPAAGATTVTVADSIPQTASNLPIGTAHPSVNAAWPFAKAGCIALSDPSQGVARALSYTAAASASANNITVKGYDIYGQSMTETVAITAGSTVNGKKAFKYIVSVTPSATDGTHTVSVGTSDIIGFNVRTDFWEYLNLFVAGAFITSNTGWTTADASTPSASTGDVRGTYALQTASNGDGTTANWATSRRVALFESLPMYNAINANNLSSLTLFGGTQF